MPMPSTTPATPAAPAQSSGSCCAEYGTTRRQFLRTVAAAAGAAGATSLFGSAVLQASFTSPAAAAARGGNVLVVLSLRGGADIVTTVTADKTRAAILVPDLIEPGMHVNAVGGDCPGKTELHADVLRGARVFVEYEPQTRVEGDIQQLPADFPVVDLWRVLAGTQPGRQHDAQVTVFDSVGFALEDFSTLRFLRDLTAAAGWANELDLVPDLADPKDLFSLLLPGARRRAARAEASPA